MNFEEFKQKIETAYPNSETANRNFIFIARVSLREVFSITLCPNPIGEEKYMVSSKKEEGLSFHSFEEVQKYLEG
jgi:hypothetical protein